MSRSASAGVRGGSVYLGTDILGSVRSATGEAGTLEDRYEYDAFGRPYKGDLDGGMNLGYTRKPYDSRTGLYNYGYRDYEPGMARFTTVDPVRDGSNWFAYVNNDPVNYTDPWGLESIYFYSMKTEGSMGLKRFSHELTVFSNDKEKLEKHLSDSLNQTRKDLGSNFVAESDNSGATIFHDRMNWSDGRITYSPIGEADRPDTLPKPLGDGKVDSRLGSPQSNGLNCSK
jgi:RHS repeat-associated protein